MRKPEYIVDRGTYLEIRRSGDRCAALHGGEIPPGAETQTRFHGVIYDDRPRGSDGNEHERIARDRDAVKLDRLLRLCHEPRQQRPEP